MGCSRITVLHREESTIDQHCNRTPKQSVLISLGPATAPKPTFTPRHKTSLLTRQKHNPVRDFLGLPNASKWAQRRQLRDHFGGDVRAGRHWRLDDPGMDRV
jgi:hypothetical protein